MIKKGIILAGGTGSRMSPLTKAVNKQLLPIYDKPLIYYPLSILMLAGIKDILIIVNKGQLGQFKKILPNENNLGIKITYAEQKYPKGLPDAFVVGKNFIGKNNVALILGDSFDHSPSKAFCAALTALSTSLALASGTLAQGLLFSGLRVSKVFLLSESTHSPPINILYSFNLDIFN